MKYVYYLINVAVLLAISNDVEAQTRDKQIRTQVDSVLTERYYKTPYDTNYVVRPEGRLTLKVRLNQSGDDIHAKGDKDGVSSKADLSTNFKTTVSIGGSYRGISAAMATTGCSAKNGCYTSPCYPPSSSIITTT